ncbi:MAG: NAD-dependent epimerase/dehydratase family protein [Candidatus Sericytochromatia bacterium]
MKNILILGGTQFAGRQLSERLVARSGLNLTLFHRGRTHPELFPEARHVFGDRETDDIRQVNRQDWDAVVDFSAYYPRTLRSLAQALCGRTGRYLLVSSISAYAMDESSDPVPVDENYPTQSWQPEDEIDTGHASYGKRKAACEQALFGLPELNPVIFRPGLMYGAYDPTDRFYYWLWRFARRQKLLVPDVLGLRSQWTYAGDFAAILEQALIGPQPPRRAYHILTHPPLSYAEFFTQLEAVCGHTPKRKLVSEAWLEAEELQFWRDFPLFLSFERLFDTRAQQQDIPVPLTPFAQSLDQSREYYTRLGWPVPTAGISPEQEDQLLKSL